MVNLKNEDIETVCKLTGCGEATARVALQHCRGNIGWTVESMKVNAYLYAKEAREIYREPPAYAN